MFERSYQRSVRVIAPMRELYQELDTIAGMIRFIPHLQAHLPGTGDDDRAQNSDANINDGCTRSMTIAASHYRFAAAITLERIDPPHTLGIGLRVRRPHLDIAGTFHLSSCARTETTLSYTARLSTTHPLLRRLPNTLIDFLEDHVAATTELIALRARQYTHAQRHLAT